MSARKTPMSTSIPIDLSDADAWDDTELIKEYEESMKNYKNAHSANVIGNNDDFDEIENTDDDLMQQEDDNQNEDDYYYYYYHQNNNTRSNNKGKSKRNKKRKTHDNPSLDYNFNYSNLGYPNYWGINSSSGNKSSTSYPPPPPPIPMSNPFGGDISSMLWAYYYYGYAMGQYQAFQMINKNEDD